ncbi:hypothetical protein C0991_006097 [Blastosporella zonata]|nr:hypothetical protein C0991_006097 [Blastosporella zonata]
MSTPSTPPKPKWSPGGAIRRTSTILSLGRSKTPSRASSEYEPDSSSLRSVAAAPPSPTPQSASPRTSLSMEPASEDPADTPSKSKLARMGGALRRPSSLIPRRRTMSLASPFRPKAQSTDSKVASAIRTSTDSAPQQILTAEPETLITASTDSSPRQPAVQPHAATPEPAVTPLPSAAAVVFTDEPEAIHETEIVRESTLEKSHEVADATITSGTRAEQEPIVLSSDAVPTPITSDEITAEPEAVTTSTIEPVPSSPVQLEEAEKQPASPISVVEQAIAPPSPAPEVAHEIESSPVSEVRDTVEEGLAASPSPVEEVVATVVAPEATLREVSSLNSSFEDLGSSAKLTAEEAPAVQEDAVVDEPNLLTTSVDVSAETEEEVASLTSFESSPLSPIPEAAVEKDEPVIVEPPVVTVLPVVQEQAAPPNLPLEIPAPSIESAAPSPSVTQPLLPLEVQGTSGVRQRNGSVAPANRDRHHPKGPQEYRSVLSTLLDALLGLIRRWRSGRW